MITRIQYLGWAMEGFEKPSDFIPQQLKWWDNIAVQTIIKTVKYKIHIYLVWYYTYETMEWIILGRCSDLWIVSQFIWLHFSLFINCNCSNWALFCSHSSGRLSPLPPASPCILSVSLSFNLYRDIAISPGTIIVNSMTFAPFAPNQKCMCYHLNWT